MSFSQQLCNTVEQLLAVKFPGINAECEMEDGIINVIFEEGKYTRKEVEDYLEEAKRKHKFIPNQLPNISQ